MIDNTPNQYPNDLTEAEYHSLATQSAIHPALIGSNFIHIAGEIVFSYLFISGAIPRKNAGRVTDGFLRQYQHAYEGGIWISGLDPQNNWQPMEWGRFKPTNPRIDLESGKPVKYESPPKTPNRVTYFDIPDCIWDEVALRYNIKRYHSPLALRLQDRLHPLNFWSWVQQHPEIPVILCEGEKKAACLLSLGFVALALPGIWNGRVGRRDFDERLHPDLMPLAQRGRKFIILFDEETKPKTRWSVFQATVRTGAAIEAVSCICEVALLPGPEKGVDDFARARGEDANALLTAIIDDAKTLNDYQRAYHQKRRGLSNKYKPHLVVNVKYLSESVRLPQSGLVVLCSDMGTGKTELLKRWRDEHPSARFLNNGHRVNLLKNLALRLQTEMYSDLGYVGLAASNALSITIDSLHKLNTQALTYGCVFIDEACQYLTHLLHSKTCKEHRAAILEVLEYIVYNVPLIVLADAHMDDVTVDFFRAMRPLGEEPFIIKNEWLNGGSTVYWYEGDDSSVLVAQISAALMTGQKIMVVSDSKRFIKKLEQSLTVQVWSDDQNKVGGVEEQGENSSYPASRASIASIASRASPKDSCWQRLRVWSIHSDNSGSEENVAFIKDITNAVKSLDALLTSPSLGTGVDIPEYHFDAVYGAFHGVSQTANECAQQLYRYRPKVPIHVWVAPRPPFGYQDTNASKIKERLLQTNEMTAFLIRIDRETGRRGAEKDWALDAYCQIMAARHQSINNLRADLRELLTDMGNQIIPMGGLSDKLAQERLTNAAAALDTAYYSAVAKANEITASEYRLLSSKDYLKPEFVFECEKFRIQDAYGKSATESLVERDQSGRLIRELINLEAILAEPNGTILDPQTGRLYPEPPTIVTDSDRQQRERLPLCMDWGNYSSSWLARFNLGVHHILKRLIAGVELTADDQELQQMTAMAINCAAHVKAILGFTVPPNCGPMWLLDILVKQLGLKLVSRKRGKRGEQVKYFTLSKEDWDFAKSVLAHREYKRAYKERQKRETTEKFQREQAIRCAWYGIERQEPTVSTPPPNSIGIPPNEGVDTKSENPNREDFEPDDTQANFRKAGVERLKDGIKQGVEAVKALLQDWTTEQRWDAILYLEELAHEELLRLELLAPQFYDWLSETNLPKSGATG